MTKKQDEEFDANLAKLDRKHKAWQKRQAAKGLPTTALEAVELALKEAK